MAWERLEKSKEIAMDAVLAKSLKRVNRGQIDYSDFSHDFCHAVVFGNHARVQTEKILIRMNPDERSRFGGLAEIAGIMHDLGPEKFYRFWRRHVAECQTLTDYEIEACKKALEMRTLPDNEFLAKLASLSNVERALALGILLAGHAIQE